MNFARKPLPLLIGAMTLSLSIGTAVLPAYSQSNPAPTNSTMPAPPPPMHDPDFLNLTAEQQSQMEQIRQNTRSQIDAILTDEQRTQLQQEFENHHPPAPPQGPPPTGEQGRPPSPFDSLNLSDEQRSQIQEIMSNSREQMDAILTDEQRELLQQHIQQHQQEFQNRSSNPAP